MVTLITDMLETICPKELRDMIRQDESWLLYEEEDDPDPVQEKAEISSLMGEIPGFDKSCFDPKEAGYDCRGCEFYLSEERRCRHSECQIRKRQRKKQAQ